MQKKRATAKEVAKLAGVSKWTVIRAFKEGASIADVSREKVMRAAEELDYTPNLIARALSKNSTGQVAILVDDFDNPHKLPFLNVVTETLQDHGMVASLINITREFDHVQALLSAEQRQVDAVVLLGTDFQDSLLEGNASVNRNQNLFVLARNSTIEGVPSISCNADAAMLEICEYVIRKGYKKPAFLAGPKTFSTGLGRRGKFWDVMVKKSDCKVFDILADEYSLDVGASAMRRYLNENKPGERADIIVCENDVLALGAMDVARFECGLSIPDDLGFIGFDNTTFSSVPSYNLTTYEQPLESMTRHLVAMIMDRSKARSMAIKGRLIIRGSS